MVYGILLCESQTHAEIGTMAKATKLAPEAAQLKDVDAQPLYTPADIQDVDYERDIGYPSEFPFTRGVQATM